MDYRVAFRPYHRRFRSPLQTSYGGWEVRSGIILQLTDATGLVGFGEIAPLAAFGSETLEQALAYCDQLAGSIAREAIFAIPDRLPACQFGFESAIANLPAPHFPNPFHSALLPTGSAALVHWPDLWAQGYCTFKWKIGVAPIDQELDLFTQLLTQLPAQAQLRLDANGGLTVPQAEQWLQICAGQPLEFLEQPLPSDQFAALLHLSQQSETPLALDESVATLTQLKTCYEQGWRGIFVIKPAILGSPARLRQFCRDHPVDAVFSTVFETAIGRQAGLQLAAELGAPHRALGYGTGHWFADPFDPMDDFAAIWQWAGDAWTNAMSGGGKGEG
jgi:o-succinylbenzoate synthase